MSAWYNSCTRSDRRALFPLHALIRMFSISPNNLRPSWSNLRLSSLLMISMQVLVVLLPEIFICRLIFITTGTLVNPLGHFLLTREHWVQGYTIRFENNSLVKWVKALKISTPLRKTVSCLCYSHGHLGIAFCLMASFSVATKTR